MKSKLRIGFRYTFRVYDKDGSLVRVVEADNLIPDEGIQYIMEAALTGGGVVQTWHIGLTETAREPLSSDTMSTYPNDAGEIDTYTPAERQELTPDTIANGLFANTSSPAEFTFTAAKTVNGGFISSSSIATGTTGYLLSAVQVVPVSMLAGGKLTVTAGLIVTSS